MNHYRVLINGTNFLIESKGVPTKLGFYTTRFVTAEDHDQAEEKAVSLIRDDEDLREKVKNEEGDRPELMIAETEELDSFDGISEQSPGLAWYSDEEK